jgi:hypothetical protein
MIELSQPKRNFIALEFASSRTQPLDGVTYKLMFIHRASRLRQRTVCLEGHSKCSRYLVLAAACVTV